MLLISAFFSLFGGENLESFPAVVANAAFWLAEPIMTQATYPLLAVETEQ